MYEKKCTHFLSGQRKLLIVSQCPYIADLMKLALGIGCLVVIQANHCIVLCAHLAKSPIASVPIANKETFIKLGI